MPHLSSFISQILQDIQSLELEVKEIYIRETYNGEFKYKE